MFKAFITLIKFKIGKYLLKMRNRPLPILKYPDKRLKTIAKEVDFNKISFEKRSAIVRKMASSLFSQQSGMRLGLAATQIGINLRVIIVRNRVMFNPEWQPSRAPLEQVNEGCYSTEGIYRVERAPYGWVKWTDINGVKHEEKIKGTTAIVFQHELDHLNGKCCADVGTLLVSAKNNEKI